MVTQAVGKQCMNNGVYLALIALDRGSLREGRLPVLQDHPCGALKQLKSCLIRRIGLCSSMKGLRTLTQSIFILLSRKAVVLAQDFVVFLTPFSLSWIIPQIAYDLFLTFPVQLFTKLSTFLRCIV
jgi:hypothetical protein